MKKPNILWIGFDQIRYDTLGANGNEVCRTPNLDGLASESVNFSRAYTPCSLCSPARASMFTGLYAFKHGMGTNCDMYHSLSRELARPEQLLHRRFQEAGYQCGFAGKWHVGTEKGPGDYGFQGMNLPGYGNIQQDEGFKSYLTQNNLSYSPKPMYYLNPDKQTLIGGEWGGSVESTPAHYLTEYTKDLIDGCIESRNPFFITCQYWGPHGPHMPSDEFYKIHDRDELAPWKSLEEDMSSKPRRIQRELDCFYRNHPTNWDEAKEIVGLYYDTTAMLDYQVGRLLDYLEEKGLRENTIVVFSTDHGDMTGAHGGMMDKGLLYEEAHHIPFFISWPSRIQQEVKGELVMNMDIMPTLLELSGIDVPEGLDGRSLTPLLETARARGTEMKQWEREALYMEFHGLRFLYSQRAIVTEDNWKYIFTPGDYDEVYNLNNDPYEIQNLINTPEHAAKIGNLRKLIRQQAFRFNDPLKDCVSKFFGEWQTGSGQIDASKFYEEQKEDT